MLYGCFKTKIIQRVYYSGKLQMFYQKAAVMETLVLKSGIFRFYAPLRIHPSASVLLVVNICNFPELHGVNI